MCKKCMLAMGTPHSESNTCSVCSTWDHKMWNSYLKTPTKRRAAEPSTTQSSQNFKILNNIKLFLRLWTMLAPLLSYSRQRGTPTILHTQILLLKHLWVSFPLPPAVVKLTPRCQLVLSRTWSPTRVIGPAPHGREHTSSVVAPHPSTLRPFPCAPA